MSLQKRTTFIFECDDPRCRAWSVISEAPTVRAAIERAVLRLNWSIAASRPYRAYCPKHAG